MSRPSTLPADPDRTPEVDRALAWLHAEQNAAESPAYTSMLLHEAGIVLEANGEEAAAQKQYRAAIALDPTFRAPLEQLIASFERTGRLEELTELFHHLRDTSKTEAERARSCLESVALELERTADFESAKAQLRQYISSHPSDATPWLLLELLGHRTGDNDLRIEAIEARLKLTDLPEYRNVLMLDLAELYYLSNRSHKALEQLEAVAKDETVHAYPALVLASRIAAISGLTLELERFLNQRLRLLERAEQDPQTGDRSGILPEERTRETLAFLQVQRALCLKTLGEDASYVHALAAAQALVPEDLVVSLLRYNEAELKQDDESLLLAGQSIGTRLEGRRATPFWLKLALNRIGRGDAQRAREFVRQGLERDEKSLPLRTLDVYLALTQNDGQTLAIAIEAMTDCLARDESRSAWLLAAAGVWALRANHSIGAKAALAQASATGLSPEVSHHAGRLLARWVGDPAFYDESTRRAQALSTSKFDRLDLGLELLRLRLLGADRRKTLDTLSTLRNHEDSEFIGQLAQLTLGRWLSGTVRAESSTALGEVESPESTPPSGFTTESESVLWDDLADRCPSAGMTFALHTIAAITELVGGHVDNACARFERLHTQAPENLVLAMARVTLEISRGNAAVATKILRSTVDANTDPNVRATLAIHGAVVGTLAGCTEDVCALLDSVELSHPESANAFSRWVLRTIAPSHPLVRRRILAAAENLGSPVRRALERFGFELSDAAGPTPSLTEPSSTEGPRSGNPTTSGDGPGAAFALLTLVRSKGKNYREAPAIPEGTKSALNALLAAIRYADVWYKDDAPSDTVARLTDARTWAELDPSLLAQLEWFLVARKAFDLTDEVLARTSIATFLGPKEAEALVVGAQQLSYLHGELTPKLLPSTSAAARFANLEVSPPGCDPRRRATALEEAADLQGPSSALIMRVNLGFNWIACGDFERARACFTELIEARPRFIPAWLGLRTIAELKNEPAPLAEACAALGDLLEHPAQGSLEWERAALLLLDVLGDVQRGKLALERAVALDITRRESYTRLFRLVREAGIHQELLALIERRLPHVEHDEERLLLYWERARTLRTLGDRPAALAALDTVTRLAPNHVGALALAGEIHIALGQFDEAARYLSQLSRLEEAPLKQRLMGALAAADLFDKKLGRPAFARDILVELYRQGHAPVALRERLAQIAVKAKAPELAVEVLETLFDERPTVESRAEVARLALVLCRDTLNNPTRALRAIECVLAHDPADAEAIDWLLTAEFPKAKSEVWLKAAEDRLREALQETPLDADRLGRLAQLSTVFDDVRTRQACLGALIAIGEGLPEFDEEILALDERIERLPTIAIDDIAIEAVSAPDDQGPLAELFGTFATTFTEALGPTLSTLGVGKKQRVDPRVGLPLRNEVVAWAGAFGIPEFDLYVTEHVEADVIAIATERPSVIVSSRLSAPLDLAGRQAVARELFALKRGLTLLRHRSHHELLALIVAACQLGEHPLASPPYAMKDEFVRLVGSALPRKLRKPLQETAHRITQSSLEPIEWLRSATHSLDRIAALASGDVSHVLALVSGQRGRLGTNREQRDRASRLIAFVVSPHYLELKDTLGLCVR